MARSPRRHRGERPAARRVSTGARRRAAQRFAEAVALARAGQAGRAEAACRAAVAEDPTHAGALHQLALLCLARGDAQAAIEALRGAARHAPADAVVRNNLANALCEIGRHDEAIEHYRAAVRERPDYLTAHYNLGKALHNLGRAPDAVHSLERARALAPRDAQVLASLGAALLDAGAAAAARDACRQAVAIAPDLAEGWNNLGLVHLSSGEFDAAADAFRAALDADPGMAVAAANLTRTRRFDGDDDADVARVERAAHASGGGMADEAELRFALGKVYDDRGEHGTAFDHYKVANALVRASREQSGHGFDATAHRTFIDELIAVAGGGFFAAAGAGGSPDDRPVLIVGMPRSGTSLIEQILASHPSIHGAGELPDLLRLRQVASARTPAGPARYLRELDAAARADLGARYAAAVGRDAAADAVRVTDKTPTNFLDLGLLALICPRARVIHCRRDPRDVAASIFSRHFTHGHAYAYDLADIAAFHNGYARLMAHWREVLPLAMLEVDYEAVVADLEGESRRLLAFCGVGWDDRCLRFFATRRTVHTASTWQVRQPLYGRAVGRWRHYGAGLATFTDALDAPVRTALT